MPSFYKLTFYLLFLCTLANAQKQEYWTIENNREISWDITQENRLPHSDNIEMAGKRVAGIITYEVDEKKMLNLERHIIFPQLRTFIKDSDTKWANYRSYLKHTYEDDILPQIIADEKVYAPGPLKKVVINGVLSFHHEPVQNITLVRQLMPSMSERLFIEQWKLKNTGTEKVVLHIGNTFFQQKELGVKGQYLRTVSSDALPTVVLSPNETYVFSIRIAAQLGDEKAVKVASNKVVAERNQFLSQIGGALQLKTPNDTLNTLFEFSKIRAAESIFETPKGLMHSPGGGRYYCGVWANDQAEYSGPFFPYLGYATANEAAINAYRLFAEKMTPDYPKLNSSFEMQGDLTCCGSDRGDAAMIAFGGAHYALASGNRQQAEELWPAIEWCLEYCKRQITPEGVIASDTDEMEGRIPTGSANLSTSSLTYGALLLAAQLGRSLNKPATQIADYEQRAQQLKVAMEAYFGANVEGLDTYKYYKEHQYLRHWICLPLVVGIFDRKDATIEALFDRLWTDNGVHVEKNSDNEDISKIFWDRGTLYALRGALYAGATDIAMEKLRSFSNKRLLGNHVPYVVEAFPEGNMAHLSAESALYCRVFIEGLWGINPSGLNSFDCRPQLPKDWNEMELNNIQAFGQSFNLKVSRDGEGLLLELTRGDVVLKKKAAIGEQVNFEL